MNKRLLYIIVLLAITACTSCSVGMYHEQLMLVVDWFVWSTIIALIIIVCITCRLFGNRRRYRKRLREQEEDFNRRIQEMRARIDEQESAEVVAADDEPSKSDIAEEPSPQEPQPTPADTKLILIGSTREQVEVDAASILFLTSESNYVKVLHLDANGKLQSKMIRQTMNNIESQLNAYPHIIRCHRAFIVNLQHVRHATTSSSGLQLSFDATTLHIPVSKTYLSLVKSSLS